MIALLQLMMMCVFLKSRMVYVYVRNGFIDYNVSIHDVKWGKYTNDIVASTCFVAFVVLAHIWVLDTGEEED